MKNYKFHISSTNSKRNYIGIAVVSKKSGKTILKNLEKRIWKNMEKIWKNVGPKNSSKKRLVNNADKN